VEPILIGTTDRTILVFIPDPASTDGSGKTGLGHSSITVSWTKVETDNDVVVTDATGSLNALTNLTDAHNDWGWKEVSSTLAPGLYRLDLADALFASGIWYTVVYVMITSGESSATPKAFRLVAHNELDGVRLGLTALPNAAAESSGGLFTRGTGAGQINQDANGRIDVNIEAIDNDTTAATNQAKAARAISRGTCGSGSTTTVVNVSSISPSVTEANTLNGRILIFDAATTTTHLRNQGGRITAVASDGSTITIDTDNPLTEAPASGDTFGVY
jgi:hypothetical protein